MTAYKNWPIVIDIRSMFRFVNKVLFLAPLVLLESYIFITNTEMKLIKEY